MLEALNVIIDEVRQQKKPQKNDYPAINNRIAKAQAQRVTVQQLREAIENGQAYLSGDLIDREQGRKKDNIKDINLISLDIDNHYKIRDKDIYTNYTREQVINRIYEIIKAKPFLCYSTFTGRNANGSEKFRLLYKIDKYCTAQEVTLLIDSLKEEAGHMIDQASDVAKIYQGTNKQASMLEDSKPIKYDLIQQLEEKKQRQEQERKQRQTKQAGSNDNNYYDNDLIEYLKQIDITDYLLRMGYSDIKKTLQGYKMPCPIHKGKKDNFHISNNNGVWLYHCFSGCGGRGGSIIDLHMELQGTSEGQAIAELSEMFNIQRKKTSTAPITDISVNKYISDNKNALSSIFEALEGNKRILLTAPMGTGKTHFIINDLFKYAQQIGRKVILVVPGAKQLENLSNNKGLAVVYHRMPVYMGNDLVATTPDSLPKITAELEDNSYILAVDETHERYTSRYRESYRNNNVEQAEKRAFKSVHMTATPRILFNDNFEKVININSQSIIKNDIEILKVNGSFGDTMVSLSKKLIKQGKQPILFNNNIKDNEAIARLIEVKEKITMLEYEEGQLNIFKPGEKSVTKEVTRVSVETVKSGKDNPDIAEGRIKTNFTATTSSIMAGIDLETEKEAVLIVNTTNLVIDNLIQLIGRFRKGIKVILLVPNKEEKKKFFILEDKAFKSIREALKVRDYANDRKIETLIDRGIKRASQLYKNDNELWETDINGVIYETYKEWSEAVFQDTSLIETILKNQNAFKVNSFTVTSPQEEKEKTFSKMKEQTAKEIKKLIEKTAQEIAQLEDSEIIDILEGCSDNAEYKEFLIIAKKQIDRVKTISKELFQDNKAKAFKHYFSNTWASIQRELEQEQARKVNRLFKEQGLDFYLSVKERRYRREADIIQAHIRNKLSDLEKKQGRITKEWLNALTYHLVTEGFIINKEAKLFNDTGDKKAFNKLKEQVKEKLNYIYNLDDSKIVSVKL